VQTVGFGHNLTAHGISQACADLLLDEDVARASAELVRLCPWSAALSPVRRAALTDLCFNLGATRLAQFTQTLASLEQGDYATGAHLLLQSRYAAQVPMRATRIAMMLRTDAWPADVRVRG
jgi:lysozyme